MNLIDLDTLRPTAPGRYVTRNGEVAVIEHGPGADGHWVGKIPGTYQHTWWHLSGRHNLFPSDDIVLIYVEDQKQ